MPGEGAASASPLPSACKAQPGPRGHPHSSPQRESSLHEAQVSRPAEGLVVRPFLQLDISSVLIKEPLSRAEEKNVPLTICLYFVIDA